MIKKVLLLVIVILLLGAILPKFFLRDKVVSLSEGPHCPQNEAAEFLDNPFEKIMLVFGGLQTLSKSGEPIGSSDTAKGESNYIVRAFTIFGIPFATLEVKECYGAVRRL